MKVYSALLALALVGSSLPLQAVTEEKLHRTFPAQPETALVVDVGFGSIEITTQPADEIVVDVYRAVKFRKKADEEAFLKNQPVVMNSKAGALEVIARAIKPETSRLNFGSRHMEAKYTISVPAKCKVDLRTSGGHIYVTGVEAPAQVRTSGGSLRFTKLRGDVDAKTSGGHVEATDCDGKIDLHTSGGSVTVRNASGSLKAISSGGNMKVNNFKGPLVVRTSGGSIELSEAIGSVEAKTSGGNIRASLNALAGPVNLDTSGGSVELSLPSNAAANLDARSSAGTVKTDLPVVVQGEAKSGELKGKINGGGAEIMLRTSGGHIALRRMKAAGV